MSQAQLPTSPAEQSLQVHRYGDPPLQTEYRGGHILATTLEGCREELTKHTAVGERLLINNDLEDPSSVPEHDLRTNRVPFSVASAPAEGSVTLRRGGREYEVHDRKGALWIIPPNSKMAYRIHTVRVCPMTVVVKEGEETRLQHILQATDRHDLPVERAARIRTELVSGQRVFRRRDASLLVDAAKSVWSHPFKNVAPRENQVMNLYSGPPFFKTEKADIEQSGR